MLGSRFGMTAAVLVLVGCTSGDSEDNSGKASATRTIAAPVQASPTARRTSRAGTNMAPQVGTVGKVRISPASPNASHTLTGSAVVLDGYTANLQWSVNGNVIPGAISDTLRIGSFKKGDKVVFSVTATKGGSPASQPVIAKVTIGNQEPNITSVPGGSLNGYQVVAIDPDREKLKFILEGAPPNMKISETGMISWPPPYEGGKKYELKIHAEDPSGARRTQHVPLEIPDQPK